MVKFTMLSATTMAILVSFVSAKNCNSGLEYCGSSLLKKGNYEGQIVTELRASGQSTSGDHIDNSRFSCVGGPNGDIKFIGYCGSGCHDAGNGANDYCN